MLFRSDQPYFHLAKEHLEIERERYNTYVSTVACEIIETPIYLSQAKKNQQQQQHGNQQSNLRQQPIQNQQPSQRPQRPGFGNVRRTGAN